jgi:hypothetical protein
MLVLAIVSVLLANFASAQEENKKKGRGQRGQNRGAGARDPFALPRSITLSDEQKKKIDDLKKQHEPALQAAVKKSQLTQEQQTAQRDARRKAREDGKQGREAQEAVDAALNLTAEQKEGRAELRKISGEIREAINGILTDDQKAQLREGRGNRKRKSDN